MFTGFIYRHIQIGALYANKLFYELLSEKKSFFTFFKIITLFHNAFCYDLRPSSPALCSVIDKFPLGGIMKL